MASRKIVRNRPSLSCSACRRRKIKCEKQRPACANCTRSGDECAYENEAEHRMKATAKKRKVSLDHELHDPHDDLHNDLHDPGNSPLYHLHSERASGRDSSSPSPLRDAGQCTPTADPEPAGLWPPLTLNNSISAFAGLDAHAEWDDQGWNFDFVDFDIGLLTPSLSLGTHQPDDPCTLPHSAPFTTHSQRGTSIPTGPPFEGYVGTREDGSKLFVEGTFWALPDVYERILRASSSFSRCEISVPYASDSPHMSLPPKHVCDALLQCFFLCVHPLLLLIHAPTLAARYGQLRARLLGEHGNIVPPTLSTLDAGFVALLWGVMYAGAVASAGMSFAASTKVPDTLAFRDHLFNAFGSAMKASSFPEAPTLDTLVAALIVQSGLGREDMYQLRTAQIVGTCIRAAQQLGLHREASRKGLGEVNSELGRRIWWHLVELDVQSAVVAGSELQAARDEGSSDTRIPNEFLEDENVLAGESTTKSLAFLLFAVGRAEIARAMRHIVVRAYDRQRPSQRDLVELNDTVASLQSRIRALSARLPTKGVPEKALVVNMGPATRGPPYRDDAGATAVFNFWARSVLHMLCLRALILLQKRFVHEFTGQRQTTLWNALVRLCCQYIQCYLRLWRWSAAAVYKWVLQSRLQPLDETLILLTYLQTEPLPAEADLAEHFAEEVLDLCYSSEQAQKQHSYGAGSSRGNLWAILNELKEKLPRHPRPEFTDLSWFSMDLNSSSVDGSLASNHWQQQHASVVDSGGIDRGLATFLQLEGLTGT